MAITARMQASFVTRAVWFNEGSVSPGQCGSMVATLLGQNGRAHAYDDGHITGQVLAVVRLAFDLSFSSKTLTVVQNEWFPETKFLVLPFPGT